MTTAIQNELLRRPSVHRLSRDATGLPGPSRALGTHGTTVQAAQLSRVSAALMTHRQLYTVLAFAGAIVWWQAAWLGWVISERDRLQDALARRAQIEVLMTDRIETVNKKAPADRIARAILDASDRHRIDPLLVLSVIETESHYEPQAVGLAGERGLMQITRSTAEVLELPWEDAFTIERNIEAGSKYLAQHLRNNANAGIARYNGGSRAYAEQVLARYQHLYGEK